MVTSEVAYCGSGGKYRPWDIAFEKRSVSCYSEHFHCSAHRSGLLHIGYPSYRLGKHLLKKLYDRAIRFYKEPKPSFLGFTNEKLAELSKQRKSFGQLNLNNMRLCEYKQEDIKWWAERPVARDKHQVSGIRKQFETTAEQRLVIRGRKIGVTIKRDRPT